LVGTSPCSLYCLCRYSYYVYLDLLLKPNLILLLFLSNSKPCLNCNLVSKLSLFKLTGGVKSRHSWINPYSFFMSPKRIQNDHIKKETVWNHPIYQTNHHKETKQTVLHRTKEVTWLRPWIVWLPNKNTHMTHYQRTLMFQIAQMDEYSQNIAKYYSDFKYEQQKTFFWPWI
jgi:hypothetical protein